MRSRIISGSGIRFFYGVSRFPSGQGAHSEQEKIVDRVINFAAGPSMMPEVVLKAIQEAVYNYEGHGFSILEMSHRTAMFDAIMLELKTRIKSLLAVPDDYEMLFCPGGGRMQFAMVPLNLCTQGCRGGYVVTGTWSRMASEEARKVSREVTLWSGSNRELPTNLIRVPNDVDYVYFCDNETVDGTEFRGLPAVDDEDAVFVSDMSSNFMSRPVDVSRYGCIWAGVQKNFGAAGLTSVIVRRDLLGNAAETVPNMLDWSVYAKSGSLPNTPPVLQIYAAMLMARWVESEGGVAEMNRRALARSELLYKTIDDMGDFYVSSIAPEARSRMNIVFTLKDESLTKDFVAEAAAQGMINLAGHRSVGGIRASLYNVMPIEAVEKLVAFMKDFAGRHGRIC